MTKLKELPILERPRERLKHYGIENLSNEELLTILIGSGNKFCSAKELSSKILASLESINDLANITYEKLTKIKGLGPSKISNLLAAIELSKRIKKSSTSLFEVKITNSSILYDYYKEKFTNQMQECFYCIYLDASKKIIKSKLLFKGTLDRSLVHPREIFKEAYLLSASSIICVHNHPSGNITPSIEDKNLTDKLVSLGLIHGIPIIDHLIIGENSYYSFYENGDI